MNKNMKLKENVTLQVIFFVIVMGLMVVLYVLLFQFVSFNALERRISTSKEETDNSLFAKITDCEDSDGKIKLNGWVIKQDGKILDTKIVFQSVLDNKVRIYDAYAHSSSELEKYAQYLQIEDTSVGQGFTTKIRKNNLPNNHCYKILLYLTYEKEEIEVVQKVFTGQFFYNEKIYSYNPMLYSSPAFEDEELANVINEGVLCGYSAEDGAWVYAYLGHLYWILDKNIEKNNEENLYIYFHLNTTQIEQLPVNRIKNKFDNKDFRITDEMNLASLNCRYRVAKLPIETEYPIAYISTGHYDGEKNLWTLRFMVPYVFPGEFE